MTLTPTSTEALTLPSGRVVLVPKCSPQFKLWRGEPISNTFGGKAVLDYEGEPLFAELVVLRILEKEGWQGVWANSFHRECRNAMFDQGGAVTLPEAQSAFLAGMHKKAGCRGGCWDVFAWRNGEYRFVELKKSHKDRIQDTQLRFLEAVLDSGLTTSDFLLCEWDIVCA